MPPLSAKCRPKKGTRIEHKLFFVPLTFRVPPGYPGKIPGYPAKKVWFPWFRGTYWIFWPPPLHVEDPYPTGKCPDSKVWVCALSSCLKARLVEMLRKVMAMIEVWQAEIRKNVMSIKFLPVILGPEMAAPILWAPGIFWFFCWKEEAKNHTKEIHTKKFRIFQFQNV